MGKKDCAYVEHDDSPLLPFHPSLEIGTKRYMVVQELEQCIAFFFFVSENIPRVCQSVLSRILNQLAAQT